MATPRRSPSSSPRSSSADIREASLALWPRPAPLECGIIAHGVRFSFNQLKKIYSYAKSKGKYPWLSYAVWSHIAKNKLHMSEELAWLYFETFDVVSDMSADERLKILKMAAECSSRGELDQLRKKISVDTMRFLLFLYIQSAPRLSLKTAVLSAEDWPSPESDRKQKSPEYAHINFLKTKMSELLQLVSLQDVDSEEEGGGVVSVESLRSLEFLLCASPDMRRLSTLTELAMQQTEHERAGYSEDSKCFSLSHLEQWLKMNISWSPFGPHALKCGTRDKKCLCFRSESLGRIATNAVITPAGTRCTLLHKINKQTLAKGEEGLAGGHVYIQYCRGSSVYLLAPLRSVQIEKCSHCLVVLGAVESVVSLNNCDNLTVITSCRRLHVSSSSDCTFHLHTLTRPLLYSSSHHLTLSPYTTHYPHLTRHMEQCAIKPALAVNEWNHPLCLGTFEQESDIWRVESPDCYRPISVPFVLEGDTQENPCPLPQEYKEKLDERKERLKEWYSLVRQAALTEEQSQQLQTAVKAKFEEWLDQTGHSSEVADLEKGKKGDKEK